MHKAAAKAKANGEAVPVEQSGSMSPFLLHNMFQMDLRRVPSRYAVCEGRWCRQPVRQGPESKPSIESRCKSAWIFQWAGIDIMLSLKRSLLTECYASGTSKK